MTAVAFELLLPSWLQDKLAATQPSFTTVQTRMRYAVDLARLNVQHRSGGPFGAAVFDMDTHALVSVGVNQVVASGLSIAHAEVVALSLAQRQLRSFDLSTAASSRRLQLVTSAEPCWMCLGAIHWAGVASVACAARDADVRAIGFDEGHKPADWSHALTARGIEVLRDVERDAAVAVLQQYRAQGGLVYNAALKPDRG